MFGNLRPLHGLAALLLPFLICPAGALTLDQEKQTHATLSGVTATLTGHSELHLTGAGDPIPGCTIHLDSEDSWLFFHQVSPSAVVSNLLPRIRVNGAVAAADTNVRVVQHVAGAVVIPHPAGYRPLEIFTGTHLSGSSAKLGTYTAYGNAALGPFADKIRSFVLKRGYTATFAQNENGTGTSRNFVAQDSDLEISLMPAGLDSSVSFVRVFPWRWTGKKGSCDVDPAALDADWHYNWNIDKNSTRDWEYVGIRQQRWWPGLDQNWQTRGVNHLSGYNEPDNPVEDAYTSLNNGSTDAAIAAWPDLLATGLRVGAPAVTDGGTPWITDFINKADAAGLRVDYVPVHYYRSFWNKDDAAGAATQLYNFLKSIHDATGRPVWVTEFNNGANWTDNAHDPNVTQNRNAIQAMVQMMDNTPWIERYAVYSRVEWFRQTHYDDGSITPMGAMYRDHVAPIAYRQQVPNTGSSGNASYLFDDHLRDTTGGNNPLVYGTPKLVPGKHGSALSLDGTDDHLSLPGRLGDSNDFSFAAWVKWNGGANWQRIFDLGNGTASNFFLTPKSGSNTLRFAIKLNNGTEQQLNAPALTPGVWTHIAVTISGDTGKLFVNGTLANTNTGMTLNPAQIGTETNYLGKSQYPDPLFGGLLDDVRFFNSALPDAQVAALAASVAPQFVADPTAGSATTNLPFSAELSTQLAAGSAVFEKIGGPAWLTVSADGGLSGVPRLADIGANELLVRAVSPGGAAATALITIPVDAPEPISRHAFDGSPLATAGSAHAVPAGGPGYAAGHSGQAMNFDGTDDHAVLPAGIASAEEITIACWMLWDGGANWQRAFDFGNGTGSYFFLTPRSGSGTLRFAIKDGATEQILETTPPAAGTWNHLAVTLGGGTGKLYLNGSLVATNAGMSIKPSDIRPVLNYLGRSQYAADPFFDGRLDEFHVFHRALDAAEIGTLRTGSAPVLAGNPLVLPQAAPGSPYVATVAGAASVPSGTVVYSKASGPAWLAVEPDGRVSGTPGIGDSGDPPFRIRARASQVLATDFEVQIPVQAPAELRSHHELDGSTADSAASFTASAHGGPGYVAAPFDRAADLDGTDDYFQLPAGVASGLGDCTFAVRFRWDGGAAWQRVFDFGNNTTQYFFLTPSSPSGTLRFAITLGGNAGQQYIETAPATPGEWTHVAVVLSGNTGTLYVNGSAAASGSITLDPSQITPALNYLGKSQWPDPYFNGAIDDFRIYTRALAAAEVRSLTLPPPAVPVPPAGFSAWASSQALPEGQDLPEADADGDGLANLLEWLFGTDALAPTGGSALPSAARMEASELGLPEGKTYLSISARIRKDRPGVTLIPEAAATLAELGTPEAAEGIIQAGPPVDDGEFEIFTWYREIPVEDAGRGFIRLRVLHD